MVTGASESHPHQQEQPLPAGPHVRTNWTNHMRTSLSHVTTVRLELLESQHNPFTF